jgi:transcriptional regulator with XRE-family HTH domain
MNGKELKEIRKANHLNQERFGELVGAHRVTISDWERNGGEVPTHVMVIARIIETYPALLPEIEVWIGVRATIAAQTQLPKKAGHK